MPLNDYISISHINMCIITLIAAMLRFPFLLQVQMIEVHELILQHLSRLLSSVAVMSYIVLSISMHLLVLYVFLDY